MVKSFFQCLIFALLTCLSHPGQTQIIPFFKSIKARSISIETSGHQGDFRSTNFQNFSTQTRFGYLFQNPGSDFEWSGHLSDRSFNLLMNFRFKDTTLYRHEFLAGIKKVNQKVNWLQSTDDPALGYHGRSELMKFVVGYQYYLVKRRLLRLSLALRADYGLSISSFTKETADNREYEYFGHRSHQAGIEFPFIFQVRLFKGAWIYLGPSPGFGYYSQDGLGQVIRTRSFKAGFRFDL